MKNVFREGAEMAMIFPTPPPTAAVKNFITFDGYISCNN
jgi:hypothetical protein